MKTGDLVRWEQGYCDIPGLVIDVRPAKGNKSLPAWRRQSGINPHGTAVLAMLPELNNDPEWFHECELVLVNEVG